MNIRHMFSRLSFATALGLFALTTTAQEMPSRYQSIDLQEAVAVAKQLRSANAPSFRVALSPSKQILQEAATGAKGSPAEKSVSSILGLATEPPVAPYYVGPVLDSGMSATRLQWQAVAGGNVTHLYISSEGAMGVRAKLVLPRGLTFGEIRVATSTAGTAESLPLNLAHEGVLWTPYTEGGAQIVEIFTPQKINDVEIQVAGVLHFVESLLTSQVAKAPGEASVPAAGSCTVDVVCPTNSSTLDAAIAERSNSVAKINFVSGGSGYLCSGTLINSNQFPAPFLSQLRDGSARHRAAVWSGSASHRSGAGRR